MNDFIKAQSERPWTELEAMSVKELIAKHDTLAVSCGLGTEHYREEIRYRRQQELTQVMVRLTKVITGLTVVITVATLYSIFGG